VSGSRCVYRSFLRTDDTTYSAELYEEQKEKFGNPDGTFRDMTYEDLKDLPKLDSVIRETLRMVSLGHNAGTRISC
jgi:hypothetical protein